MKLSIAAFLIASACLGFGSCAATKPAKKEQKPEINTKPKPEAPKIVGRIASIPADKRFVLIQSYGKWTVETGTILTTRGPDGRSANLLVTGESMGEFSAADLQSGQVEVGDGVYSQHVPKPPTAFTSPESLQNQQKAENENVQKNN